MCVAYRVLCLFDYRCFNFPTGHIFQSSVANRFFSGTTSNSAYHLISHYCNNETLLIYKIFFLWSCLVNAQCRSPAIQNALMGTFYIAFTIHWLQILPLWWFISIKFCLDFQDFIVLHLCLYTLLGIWWNKDLKLNRQCLWIFIWFPLFSVHHAAMKMKNVLL